MFKVFRALMAICAIGGFKTRQLDAINAFLNAWNDRPIYCHLPDGFKKRGKLLYVLKALYGQRTSPLNWLRELTSKCIELGLYQIPGELCLFTDHAGILLFFYVDDLVVIFRVDRERDAERLITKLKGFFKFTNQGRLGFFLGVRCIQNYDAGTMTLVQDAFIIKLVKKYDIDITSKPPKTPLPAIELTEYDDVICMYRAHQYRERVGSICYPASITRPDIAKAASKLSEFLTNPGPSHIDAANHCLRYLYHTRNFGIRFAASGGGELTTKVPHASTHVFEATSDASYANGPERRSAEGYTFKLFGGMIDWAARKQATVSTSTTEAELLGMLHAGKQTMWWMNLFTKLHLNLEHDVILYNDNTQTIRILKSELDKAPTKLLHIDVAQCWLRQAVQIGHLDVAYLPTAQMVADGLTKLLPAQKHDTFIKQLGLKDVTDEIDRAGMQEGV